MQDRGLRAIAAVQMLGGAYGIITIPIFVASGLFEPSALIFAVLCIAPAIAAIGLWKKRPGGIKLSILLQGLQIFSITSGAIAYKLLLGADASLYYQVLPNGYPSFGFSWKVGGGGFFLLNYPDTPFGFGVNFVSLAFFVYLILYWRENKPELLPTPPSQPQSRSALSKPGAGSPFAGD